MKGCFYWLHSVPLGTRGSHLSLAWRQDDAGGRRPRTQWPTRQENDALRRADLTSVNPPWKKVTSHAWHSGCVNYKGCLGILQNIFCWFVVLQSSYLHHCGYAALFWQPHVCWRNEAAAQFSFCRLLGGSACGNSDQVGQASSWMLRFPPNHCSSLKIPNSYLCFMTLRSGSPIVFESGNPELILVIPHFYGETHDFSLINPIFCQRQLEICSEAISTGRALDDIMAQNSSPALVANHGPAQSPEMIIDQPAIPNVYPLVN